MQRPDVVNPGDLFIYKRPRSFNVPAEFRYPGGRKRLVTERAAEFVVEAAPDQLDLHTEDGELTTTLDLWHNHSGQTVGLGLSWQFLSPYDGRYDECVPKTWVRAIEAPLLALVEAIEQDASLVATTTPGR